MSNTRAEEQIPKEISLETLPGHLKGLEKWGRSVKTGSVDSASAEDPGDIVPHVIWYRGGEVVALGFADAVNRDRGLQMLRMGVSFFRADMVDVLLDAHMAGQEFLERYGRTPDPHELQNLCDNEGACEIGLTTDCIVCVQADKDGRQEMVMLPYHVDRKLDEVTFVDKGKAKKARRNDDKVVKDGQRWVRITKNCHWMDDKATWFSNQGEDLGVQGRVHDAIKEAFEAKNADQLMAEYGMSGENFDLTPEQTRIHTDMVGLRLLTSAGFNVAYATRTDEEREILERSMARNPLAKMMDEDGNEIDLSAERADMDDLDQLYEIGFAAGGTALRERLRKQSEEIYEQDMAEAARRRAEREKRQSS